MNPLTVMPRRCSCATKLAIFGISSVLLILFVARTDVAALRASTPAAILTTLASGTTTASSSSSLSSSPPGTDVMANSSVDLGWYAPSQTLVNNLTNVVSNSTTGVYGFIYNSSQTSDEEYGTYNWCNMPHVRATEYIVPEDEYELVYVELIHRHHKRTPYSPNAFPTEPYTWDCDDSGVYSYSAPFSDPSSPTPNAGRNASAQAYWQGTSDLSGFTNPFEKLATGWKGSCKFPQITAPGLDDSWQHGVDLYDLYGDLLGFLPSRDCDTWRDQVKYRVTNNVITSEVAGMLINGMWATTSSSSVDSVPLLIQPSGIDSLEPTYTCPSSSTQFSAIKSSSNAAWAAHLADAKALYAELDGISGVSPTDTGFHASFDHYYDNLSARQCHGKPLPCKLVNVTTTTSTTTTNDTSDCVTQDMADAVYRLGNWEYSQIYRDAGPASLAASVGSYGVWIAELAAHLRAVLCGDSQTIWFHSIGHDGSLSRLLSILQIDEMVWPGMGSEVVIELWRKNGGGSCDSSSSSTTATVEKSKRGASASEHYVRVFWGGKVLNSSNPSLGSMDMLPVETLLAYFDGLAGVNASLVVDQCHSS